MPEVTFGAVPAEPDLDEAANAMNARGHHVWCNYAMGPAAFCPHRCERLWMQFPYETVGEAMSLVEQHFPDVIVRR